MNILDHLPILNTGRIAILAIAWVFFAPAQSHCQNQQAGEPPKNQDKTVSSAGLAKKLYASYKRPKIGAPDLRESQAIRGSKAGDGMEIKLVVPPPDETGAFGATLKEAPALYWIQTKACKGKIEIAITDVKTSMPIFKFLNRGELSAGLNKLDLAKHSVNLQPGRDYKWSIIYHTTLENPSNNIVESTTIRRISGQVGSSMTEVEKHGSELAQAGAWLDVTDLLATEAFTKGNGAELAAWLSLNGLVGKTGR